MPIVALACGVVTGFSSGLLGVGGAIVFIPLMLFVPEAVGLEPLPIPAITGLSAIAVLVGSVTAGLGHRWAGATDGQLIVVVGVPMFVTALIGGAAAVVVPPVQVLVVFASMATIAAVLLVSKSTSRQGAADANSSVGLLPAAIGGGVGLAAGIVGAGGAFLLAPALSRLGGVSLRIAIGSSLWIALIGTSGAAIAKGATGQVPWQLVPVLAVGIVIGALLGVRTNLRTPETRLRVILLLVVLIIAARSWVAVWAELG